jgi:hypothetical protein
MSTFLKLLKMLALVLFFTGNVYAACVNTNSRSESQRIFAGQNINAGSIFVTVEGGSLVVTYELAPGWFFNGKGSDAAHLWVGADRAALPTTKDGTPIPGKFTFKSGNIDKQKSFEFIVPLNTIGFGIADGNKVFSIYPHGSLSNEKGDSVETAWGGNLEGTGPRWYHYFEVELTNDCRGLPEDGQGGTGLVPENPAITTPVSPS